MNYMIIERDKLNLKKLQPMKMKRITVFYKTIKYLFNLISKTFIYIFFFCLNE